jgi:hypothetical protein
VPQPAMNEWLIPSFVDLPTLAADAWEEDRRYSAAGGELNFAVL